MPELMHLDFSLDPGLSSGLIKRVSDIRIGSTLPIAKHMGTTHHNMMAFMPAECLDQVRIHSQE